MSIVTVNKFNTMKTKEELQAIYFGFYDQLPEPIRSEAKERWDYEYANGFDIPNSASRAIHYGWVWDEESKKWAEIEYKIQHNQIPLTTPDLPNSTPTLSDIKNQLDRVEVLLNKLIEKK